uniref:limulus clotting factor C n=1 Tax=Panagrolaimus superbus TaxID=310955 RepID=A0A914Z8Y3_9BILA
MLNLFLLGFCVGTSLAALQDCGKTPISPDITKAANKIVGGEPAKPYSWPWQVDLCKVDDGDDKCNHVCGGSVIDEQWILSASHCKILTDVIPGKWFVKVGTYDYRDLDEPGEKIFNVSQVFTHPNYNNPYADSNDIALFKIDGKINFTKHIQPVCVPRNVSDIIHNGKSAYVTGWGTTSEGGEFSFKLKQVQVPFLDMSQCIKEYPGGIDDTMECAGKEGLDSCQGDSGGPLVTKHSDGRWFQAGIVSFGKGCAEEGFAGVYSSPSANCDFMASIIGYDICQ